MTTMKEQFEQCKGKFLWKAEYYKLTLRAVLGSLGAITVVVISVGSVALGPIQDIAAMKQELKTMHQKVDKILNGDEKEESVKTENQGTEISVDPIMLENPVLRAVCKHD